MLEIEIDGYTVKQVANELNRHPDNIRLYKRELNQVLNPDDFDWIGYSKVISKNAYQILKTYHSLIQVVGKKEAQKQIVKHLEG